MIGKITQVEIKNYRSLAAVRVRLGKLTFLVGPNGAGKSNFLDALRFVSDALNTTPANAFRDRGGIDAVRRRSSGHPRHFGTTLHFELDSGRKGTYAFEVAAAKQGAFTIKQEACQVDNGAGQNPSLFDIRQGKFYKLPKGIMPKIEKDRLALAAVGASPEFSEVFELLSKMQFYNLVPDRIRELQDPDPGMVLHRDGGNAAAVLLQIERVNKAIYERVCDLLGAVVPGTTKVKHSPIGPKETLQFWQDVGDKFPWKFEATNMSDGTLRVLGVLLSIYQQPSLPLVGIEEPESTVHPGAAEVLVDIFRDGTAHSQIVITTHSPDILDDKDITDDDIRVVGIHKGITTIQELNDELRKAIRERLCTAGELLRSGALEPTVEPSSDDSGQLELFEWRTPD